MAFTFLLILPIVLLWRQWAIPNKRWSNLNIIVYGWLVVWGALVCVYDVRIPFIYFSYWLVEIWAIYWFICFLFLFWTYYVLAIGFWAAKHTLWRHFHYNILLQFNIKAYDFYSKDYREDLFIRWYQRQKWFKIFKNITIHHSIFYYLAFEFFIFYLHVTPQQWLASAAFLRLRYFEWILYIYIVMLIRSFFVRNLLTSHMYFFYNNTFSESLSDVNYFVNDGGYTVRLRKEINPAKRSGFRQSGRSYKSYWRMYRLTKIYQLDYAKERGRFMMPISWTSFKYESYDFISTTYSYRIKSRIQRFWFQAALNLAALERYKWKFTFFPRTKKRYKKDFFLKKKIENLRV